MFRNDETGASAVEFAIVVPLLLILIFGIVEMSLLLYNKAVITNASREGARLGILIPSPNRKTIGEIRNKVREYCDNRLITFGAGDPPTVDPEPTGPDCSTAIVGGTSAALFGDCLNVTVTYRYDFLVLPGFISSLGDWQDLRAKTTMKYE